MSNRARHHFHRVGQVDRDLVKRCADLPESRIDHALRALSRSADRGRLWLSVAAVLAARKGVSRRAALRGVGAISVASAAANLVGKNLFARSRPAAALLPDHRAPSRRPTSSSFPSGHAASAAAFCAALTLESPTLGAAVLPLAAAVAYSRVHTGVHWPSDVAAGAAIGVIAANATLHWWPRHPDTPGHTDHVADVPALGAGAGMIALVNPHSGTGGQLFTDIVGGLWPQARIVHPDADGDLIEQVTELVRSTEGVRALGVAGGDGTVAAVASVAAEFGLPLVLVPAGTLNHFARDVGVPGAEEAAAAVSAGTGVLIDLAGVDIDAPETGARTGDDGIHRWFVNTASLGGYPEMVRLRERLEERGWPKWPAAALALSRVLRRAQPIRLALNGRAHLVWMLFVGNGTYEPKGFAPTRRPALDTGLLDIRYLRADVPFSRVRFVLATLTRTLETSHVYRQHDLPALDVRLLERPRRVATDGEVGPLGSRFTFRSRPRALSIYRSNAESATRQTVDSSTATLEA